MKKWLKSGIGESVGLAAVSLLIAVFVVFLCGIIQLSNALTDITKAATAAGRSAAVCLSYDDAQEQAQRVAESAITNSRISNIQTKVSYADGATAWEPGGVITVAVSGYVSTLEPFVTSGNKTRRTVVTIENSAKSGIDIPDGMGTKWDVAIWQSLEKSSDTNKLASENELWADTYGYIKINGRYMVSCTTTFGKVGDYIEVKLENGVVIPCVIGHTISPSSGTGGTYGTNGGQTVITFIVDQPTWSGDRPGTSNFYATWNSKIAQILNLGYGVFS